MDFQSEITGFIQKYEETKAKLRETTEPLEAADEATTEKKDMGKDLMEQWDYWRSRIAGGDAGSAPRDWFESVVDWLAEKAADWHERYIICCEDSKLSLEAERQRADCAEARLRELIESTAAMRDECRDTRLRLPAGDAVVAFQVCEKRLDEILKKARGE